MGIVAVDCHEVGSIDYSCNIHGAPLFVPTFFVDLFCFCLFFGVSGVERFRISPRTPLFVSNSSSRVKRPHICCLALELLCFLAFRPLVFLASRFSVLASWLLGFSFLCLGFLFFRLVFLLLVFPAWLAGFLALRLLGCLASWLLWLSGHLLLASRNPFSASDHLPL